MADIKKQSLNPQTSIAVILTNSLYEGENVKEGQFADLKQSDQDKELIKEFAAKIGFPLKSDYIISNGNQNSYKIMEKKLKKEVLNLSEKNEVVVFVYYSGHGVQLERSTNAVIKHDNMIKLYNIDQLVFNLASLPNVFVFSLFDCCREIRKQQDEGSSKHTVGNEINGHLYQIYSTVSADVTAINKNEKYSEVTLSFVNQCKKGLGTQKQEIPLQGLLMFWQLKARCPIHDYTRAALFLKYDESIKPQLIESQPESNPKQDTQENEYLCPNGHKLKLYTDISMGLKKKYPGMDNVLLDCCKVKIGSTKTPYYSCEQCGFQLCTVCIKGAMFKLQMINRLCPRFHFMLEFYKGQAPPTYGENSSVQCNECQECDIEEDSYYHHCQLCSYDRCQHCNQKLREKLLKKYEQFQKSGQVQSQHNTSKKQTCFNGHPLEFLQYESQEALSLNLNCNLCRYPITYHKQIAYNCSQCDFDKCIACYYSGKNEIQPKAQCPNKHLLDPYRSGNRIIKNCHCDVCGINVGQNKLGTYRCSTCNFDRCSNCYDSNKLQ